MDGSDEEIDEPLEVDSDEDLSDGEREIQDEVSKFHHINGMFCFSPHLN